MQYISITDYLLLPLYLVLFYLLAVRIGKKGKHPDLIKFFFTAFWLRIFGSIIYALILQYYYGYGDSFTFYNGSNFYTSEFAKDPGTLKYLFSNMKEVADWYNANGNDQYFSGYFNNPSNNMVMKICAVTSYFAFNKFLIITLFFGFFSFVGQWKLFLVFDKINMNRHRKLLAFATLYTPSIWFWGSGLIKDSICLGAAGFIIHILYSCFIKKKISVINLFFLVLLIYIVSIIKIYITVIMLAGLVAFAFITFFKLLKNAIFKIAAYFILFIVGAIVISTIDLGSQLSDIAKDSVTQIEGFQNNYQVLQDSEDRSKGGFEIGDIDPSLTGIALKSPYVIFTTLYRPFPWEGGSIMILLTSLESMLLLISTLYLLFKTKFIGFFTTIFGNPYLMFCFVITILFALVIGFTTFNFGTMIRYKIIFLPFFYFLLAYIYSQVTDKKILIK